MENLKELLTAQFNLIKKLSDRVDQLEKLRKKKKK